MTPADVERLLAETGAIRRGHFQLSSGLHSPMYVQCAAVLQHPHKAARLADALAAHYRDARISAVVAPALGGITWGYELARALGARAVFVERNSDGRFALRRFELTPGERVLVAEDVLTTGGSTLETIEVVRAAGGQVVGVAAILDRSGGSVDLEEVPLRALLTQQIETYPPPACPLCQNYQPLEKPGSRPAR
ncbi:MAG: orotate phosphoribosyltransferase [Candidatus Rokuibacteriota bacterium]